MTDAIRCSRCQRHLAPEAFAPSQRKAGAWCRTCRTDYMRDYHAIRRGPVQHHPPKPPPSPPRVLVTHGRKPSGARWRRLQEQVWAEETHCGICGEPVDQTLHYNHPMARSVDHITPVALGGAMYERTNVRLAHRSCNSKAGATLNKERFALVRAALWMGSIL